MAKEDRFEDLDLESPLLDDGFPSSSENEFAFDDPIQGEQIDNANKNYDLFFLTEDLLYSIEKNFRGYTIMNRVWKYNSQPIARDEIISQFMNAIRSIVNPINMTSSMEAEEIAFDLLEKITEVIYTAYEEMTVDDDKLEHIVNVVDHTIQIFAGHIKSGHGSKFARQMYANVYHEPDKSSTAKKSIWEDFIKFN